MPGQLSHPATGDWPLSKSRRWQAKLVESGSAEDLDRAGDGLREVDPDGAMTLHRAAAVRTLR
jgi:hypothetical protein